LLSGRYEILRPIGAGGMGVVYLALDKKLDKKWAVKEIRLNKELMTAGAKEIESVRAELWALKSLDYKSLPRIVDVFWERESAYLVMDLVEGENLRDMAERMGGLPQDAAVAVGTQLADTLNYLHSRTEPVIYRDLKPSNVVVKSDGSIMLVDLGASRLLSEVASASSEGTRRYASPEQLSGTVDERSDIFSLGRLLQVVTGDRKCSRGFRRVIRKCTRENPKERYQSALEVGKALARLEGQRRQRGTVIGIATVVLVCICLGDCGLSRDEAAPAVEIEEEGKLGLNDYAGMARERQEAARQLLVEENYSQVSLGRAILLLEESEKLLEKTERSETMECRIENLSMLSTIYKLLGQKDSTSRHEYYGRAEKYIEELFEIESVKGTSLYRLKLSDLVGMKQEQGDTDEAIKMLEEWERENPGTGKELYYAHMTMLLEEEGNEAAVSRLFSQMQSMKEVTQDFRFADFAGRVHKYLGR